jgi:ABC-2 type transport system permease protein/oleandomycin transport system permease protein
LLKLIPRAFALMPSLVPGGAWPPGSWIWQLTSYSPSTCPPVDDDVAWNLLGRTTADLVRNILIIGLMIGVGYLVGFRFQAGVIPALACVALVAAFGFALSWIFAFVSLVVRGAETAQTAGFVLLFPLVFASSVFVPVSTLPNWLQPIAKASPVTLTANAARTLALTGGVPDSLGGALAWIVGIVAVFVPLSVWRYRRMS